MSKKTNNSANKNSITIPIKSIDFDKFINKFKIEMNCYFNKLDKAKNQNKIIESNKKIIKNILDNNKFSKKQIKDIKILYDILEKRDILNDVVNKRNEIYINKLKKLKIKITEKNTYKIVKKNIIKQRLWDKRSYNLVSKNGKQYFSKNISLFYKNFNSLYKTLNLLENLDIESKIKTIIKLNKLKFVPKIVEIIIIKKNNIINEIKIISNYVKGTILQDYLKKNKLKIKDKDILKNKIHEKIKKINDIGVNTIDILWKRGILIDNKKNVHILTGFNSDIYTKKNINVMINSNGKYYMKFNSISNNLTYVILNNMLKKKIIKFK